MGEGCETTWHRIMHLMNANVVVCTVEWKGELRCAYENTVFCLSLFLRLVKQKEYNPTYLWNSVKAIAQEIPIGYEVQMLYRSLQSMICNSEQWLGQTVMIRTRMSASV